MRPSLRATTASGEGGIEVPEIVDLVRDGGEAEALCAHLLWLCLPEYVEQVEDVQRAIVLCVRGLFEMPVCVGGQEHGAGHLVAVLDLERFVRRRMSAWVN
jgi:hypothetical protein